MKRREKFILAGLFVVTGASIAIIVQSCRTHSYKERVLLHALRSHQLLLEGGQVAAAQLPDSLGGAVIPSQDSATAAAPIAIVVFGIDPEREMDVPSIGEVSLAHGLYQVCVLNDVEYTIDGERIVIHPIGQNDGISLLSRISDSAHGIQSDVRALFGGGDVTDPFAERRWWHVL